MSPPVIVLTQPDQDLIWRQKVLEVDEVTIPARTLFVAQSWPVGADPLVYFTSISAALIRASVAFAPLTQENPAVIQIYPGTYSEALTLVSNVHLFAPTTRCVILSGAITWHPGAGVNLPQSSQQERIYTNGIKFSGSLSIDSAAKVTERTTWNSQLSNIDCAVTMIGKPAAGASFYQVWAGRTCYGPSVFKDVNVVMYSMEIGDHITMQGATSFDLSACNLYGGMALQDTSEGSAHGTDLDGAIAVGATNVCELIDCAFKSAVLTVAAGGVADIRDTNYKDNTRLAGLGIIDRSIWRTTIGPTVIGANAVPIAPPLPDGNYSVVATQTAGGATTPIISARTGAGFTLTDAVGGATFDLCVLRDS